MEKDTSFKGNIAAIDFIVSKNFQDYIPGHGLVGEVAMPQKYRVYLAILRSKVGELYEEGMADFEMKPDVINAVSAYEKWVGFDMRVDLHISQVYSKSRPGSLSSLGMLIPCARPKHPGHTWKKYYVEKHDFVSKLKIYCYTFSQ